MNRIKQLRKEKEITQDVLADLLGLEVAAISKLETGRVPLRDEYILKLADFFNVSTDYLLGKTDVKKTTEIKEDEIDIAFYEGYKDLEDEDKEVMRNTLKAFLRNKNRK